MGRLIIDDTTIYELDEECLKQKEQEKASDMEKREAKENRAFIRDRRND